MKKILAIIVAVILCCAFVVPASAAVPTSITLSQIETSKAPTVDGTVDSIYGTPIFDISAKDFAIGDKNLFMSDVMENGTISETGTYGGSEAAKAKFAATYNIMRTVAYATYDEKNLYLAFDTTDYAPKAADNSAQPWRSTNFQLCMYVNQRLAFFTVAYTGKNKVVIANDSRNEFDVDVMKAVINEKSQNNFVYELVIPWSAAPGLKSAADVSDIRFGYVQSSMAEAYICTSVGEGWHQDYDKLVPVTMKNIAGETTNNGGSTTTTITSTVEDGTSAPTGGGTQINTDSKDDSSAEQETENDKTTGEETVVVEEEKDYTLVIILGIVAAVVLIGGIVAIILLNKKPAEEAKK